ncbi:hypothetical protein [Lentilactobacillus kisonensis]|uniref:hypothetical protein n=1 Tax=Lentilactobacillus kisonensis TaxID=481722 RepID=UPI000AFB608F|nr:hypothetical protein [Lentilactobacillus kisonensis]
MSNLNKWIVRGCFVIWLAILFIYLKEPPFNFFGPQYVFGIHTNRIEFSHRYWTSQKRTNILGINFNLAIILPQYAIFIN